MISSLLPLLKETWKPLALFVLAIGLYLAGYFSGVNDVKKDWEVADTKARLEAALAKEREQHAFNRKAAEYEAERIASQKKLTDLQRRLKNAQLNNSIFSVCCFDDEFMQLYRDAADGKTGYSGQSGITLQ